MIQFLQNDSYLLLPLFLESLLFPLALTDKIFPSIEKPYSPLERRKVYDWKGCLPDAACITTNFTGVEKAGENSVSNSF